MKRHILNEIPGEGHTIYMISVGKLSSIHTTTQPESFISTHLERIRTGSTNASSELVNEWNRTSNMEMQVLEHWDKHNVFGSGRTSKSVAESNAWKSSYEEILGDRLITKSSCTEKIQVKKIVTYIPFHTDIENQQNGPNSTAVERFNVAVEAVLKLVASFSDYELAQKLKQSCLEIIEVKAKEDSSDSEFVKMIELTRSIAK